MKKTGEKPLPTRIRMQMEGGIAHFPGLARPHEVDIECLAADDAGALAELIEQSGLRKLPAVVGAAARGAADYRQYNLTLIENGKERHVRVIEPIENAALARLIEFLRKR